MADNVIATLTVITKSGERVVHQMDLLGLASLMLPLYSAHGMAHKHLASAVDSAAAYSLMHKKRSTEICKHFQCLTEGFHDYVSDLGPLLRDL